MITCVCGRLFSETAAIKETDENGKTKTVIVNTQKTCNACTGVNRRNESREKQIIRRTMDGEKRFEYGLINFPPMHSEQQLPRETLDKMRFAAQRGKVKLEIVCSL